MGASKDYLISNRTPGREPWANHEDDPIDDRSLLSYLVIVAVDKA